MEFLWFGLIGALLFIFAGAWDYVNAERQIHEPTRLIIRKIQSGEFIVSNHWEGDEYTLMTPNGKTVYTEWRALNSWSVRGEFEWMNQYEVKRVGQVLKSIADERAKKYHEACKIEKSARDEKARAASRELYKE